MEKAGVFYPEKELTGNIIGAVYEVYNRLGFGYPEKTYQEAIGKELEIRNLIFKRENISKITYKDSKIGYFFHDFLIGGKVVLEVKVGTEIMSANIGQVLSYLKNSRLKVGLVAVFTKRGVLIKRVVS